MAMEWLIGLDCGPKDRVGVEALVAAIKSRSAVDGIIAMLRRSGDQRPVEQLTITKVLRRPEGDTETQVSIAELQAGAAVLEQERSHCAGCPANLRQGDGFGCYGSINYPLDQSVEDWLVARLPADGDSLTAQLLKRAIADFGYDGAPSARMRSSGQTFMTSRTPSFRSWGKKGFLGLGGSYWQVTSDQLMHALFHVGTLGPEHAGLMCAFLGVVPEDALRDPAARKAALASPNLPPAESEGQRQIAMFLRALAFAASHDLPVGVSP